MAKPLTFIHAADLHIGAPFKGLRALSDRWADQMAESVITAYNHIISAAIELNVDFVVFAGDIFDEARASYSDYTRFFAGLEKLDKAGICAYLLAGNHDPMTHWRRDFHGFPERARMIAADAPGYILHRDRDGDPLCVIAGRSFFNNVWTVENPVEGLTRSDACAALGEAAYDAPYAVGVLHTGLQFDRSKAPVTLAELHRAGFDYWALGHIHTPYRDDPANPRVVFPGNIQGLDCTETGRRGVCLVTLEAGRPNTVEFIPTASVVWENVEVDVSDCETISGIVEKTVRELFQVNGKDLCDRMVTRITLVGTTELYETLRRPGLAEEIRTSINGAYSEFFCDSLVNATRRPINREALKAQGMFPAELMQLAQSQRAHQSVTLGYLQDEMIRRGVSFPDSSCIDLDELSTHAEDMLLDLLLGTDE